MSKSQSPFLTDSAIHLGHLCALETWQGYSYSVDKRYTSTIVSTNKITKNQSAKVEVLSDEYFMLRCTQQVFSILSPKKHKNDFLLDSSFLDAFRKTAGIKQSERRGPKPDYLRGIRYIKKEIADDRRRYNRLAQDDKILGIVDAIQKLSIAFTNQTTDQLRSEHVMLATRLLFFFMPDALVFNYSTEIAKMLKLTGNAQKDIEEYQLKMWEGLNRNWHRLCDYEMPLPTILDESTYQIAKRGGWWQRRIYDLALKFHSTNASSIVISHKVKRNLFTKPCMIT
jgi:hypothetical protein